MTGGMTPGLAVAIILTTAAALAALGVAIHTVTSWALGRTQSWWRARHIRRASRADQAWIDAECDGIAEVSARRTDASRIRLDRDGDPS